MTTSLQRFPRLALALAAVAILGCPSSSEKLSLSVEAQVKTGPTQYAVVIATWVDAAAPVQAFDLDYTLTTTSVDARIVPLPHPAFDDDNGRLFRAPSVDPATGAIEGVIDVRHGEGSAQSGKVPLALAVLIVGDAQPASVRVSGRIAGPDGVVRTAEASASLKLPAILHF